MALKQRRDVLDDFPQTEVTALERLYDQQQLLVFPGLAGEYGLGLVEEIERLFDLQWSVASMTWCATKSEGYLTQRNARSTSAGAPGARARRSCCPQVEKH